MPDAEMLPIPVGQDKGSPEIVWRPSAAFI
jgi:hypothetical protein